MRAGDLVKDERGNFVGICIEDTIEAGTPVYISTNGIFKVKASGIVTAGINGSIFSMKVEHEGGIPIIDTRLPMLETI